MTAASILGHSNSSPIMAHPALVVHLACLGNLQWSMERCIQVGRPSAPQGSTPSTTTWHSVHRPTNPCTTLHHNQCGLLQYQEHPQGIMPCLPSPGTSQPNQQAPPCKWVVWSVLLPAGTVRIHTLSSKATCKLNLVTNTTNQTHLTSTLTLHHTACCGAPACVQSATAVTRASGYGCASQHTWSSCTPAQAALGLSH
jgi:hypothetical protein